MENISDNAITWSYKVNGDDLTMTSPTGQTYTAKMNGPEAPMQGDPGITTVSVKSMGKKTLEETDHADGKGHQHRQVNGKRRREDDAHRV